jgi:hypothetical protein
MNAMKFSKDCPDKSTGYWCRDCGRAMGFNVPRLQEGGGFVHADTGLLGCDDTVEASCKRMINGVTSDFAIPMRPPSP